MFQQRVYPLSPCIDSERRHLTARGEKYTQTSIHFAANYIKKMDTRRDSSVQVKRVVCRTGCMMPGICRDLSSAGQVNLSIVSP